MKRILPILLTLLALLAGLQISALAQTSETINLEDSESDDAAPATRVARLSFMDGDVSFLRAGVTEWAPAVENLPLLAGDQIYAARGARAEIQLGRGNYIRLSENTELTIAGLSENSAQFEITEGVAIIRVERLASAFGRFEIDTPNSAVVLQKDGFYRIDVRGEKESELIVRGGEAEVSTDEGSFRVREGHRLLVDTTAGGKLELALDTTRDDWDQWSYDRDQTIARTSVDVAPASVTNYETTYNDFYGVSDLSSYGTWTNYSSYGQCWIPRVGSDWAPYRLGQWIWIPSTGWTWLSSEPWGWAPYHYGRWAYLSGLGWAWIPGFGPYNSGYGYRDYHWRPALVFFFNCSTPNRHYVGWHPLAPGERWRRPDRRDRDDNHAHLQYPNQRGRMHIQPIRNGNGVTVLPLDGFARGDRTAGRPGAPGRDLSDSMGKGVRPGLPEIKPVAVAPSLEDNDRRRNRRIAVPSDDLIRRPVVTRNQDANTGATVGTRRERRLISPPERGDSTQGPALVEGRSERRDRRSKLREGSDSADTSPGIRPPHSTSPAVADVEKAKGEQSERREQLRQQRRLEREQKQEQPPAENREQVRQERRQERERNQAQDQPRPENREQVRQERRQEKQQEQPKSENREQVRQEHRQEKQQQQQQQQQQPKPENHEQTRQERHQQPEQRPQQQEQRKKP